MNTDAYVQRAEMHTQRVHRKKNTHTHTISAAAAAAVEQPNNASGFAVLHRDRVAAFIRPVCTKERAPTTTTTATCVRKCHLVKIITINANR